MYDMRYNTTQIFGFDREFAYTKDSIDGDQRLRAEIRSPKQTLGLCTALATETNGTIFSKSKMRPDRKNVRLAATIAKRVAKTAHPSSCQGIYS